MFAFIIETLDTQTLHTTQLVISGAKGRKSPREETQVVLMVIARQASLMQTRPIVDRPGPISSLPWGRR